MLDAPSTTTRSTPVDYNTKRVQQFLSSSHVLDEYRNEIKHVQWLIEQVWITDEESYQRTSPLEDSILQKLRGLFSSKCGVTNSIRDSVIHNHGIWNRRTLEEAVLCTISTIQLKLAITASSMPVSETLNRPLPCHESWSCGSMSEDITIPKLRDYAMEKLGVLGTIVGASDKFPQQQLQRSALFRLLACVTDNVPFAGLCDPLPEEVD